MHATLEDTKPENAVEALKYILGIYQESQETAIYGSNMTAAERQAYLRMTPHDALEYDVNDLEIFIWKREDLRKWLPILLNFRRGVLRNGQICLEHHKNIVF